MKVFGLSKTVMLAELLTPSLLLTPSHAHRAVATHTYTKQVLGFSKTCSHAHTATQTYTKQDFGLSKRHSHRAIIHTTQCRFLAF